MSIDDGSSEPKIQQPQLSEPQYQSTVADQRAITPNPIQNVVDAMKSVDTNSPEAKLNATSMDDNNGGRIEFNEEVDSKKV